MAPHTDRPLLLPAPWHCRCSLPVRLLFAAPSARDTHYTAVDAAGRSTGPIYVAAWSGVSGMYLRSCDAAGVDRTLSGMISQGRSDLIGVYHSVRDIVRQDRSAATQETQAIRARYISRRQLESQQADRDALTAVELLAEQRAAAIVRPQATADTLLASPILRPLAAEVVEAGHATSATLDAWATRRVQHEATAVLAARRRRRGDRAVAEAARTAKPGRIADLVPLYAARREEEAAAKKQKRIERALAGERLGRATVDDLLPTLLERVDEQADQIVRCVVRCVGRIGDQCRRDLKQMETSSDGTRRVLRKTTLHRVEHLSDWSSALVTMRDYSSFRSRNGSSRGGSAFRCYLVVRDSTTGEAHILRVPPKFGNATTQFFSSFRSTRLRIAAARDWCADGVESGGRELVTA